MFVRFRKISSDGIRPRAAAPGAARIMCRHPLVIGEKVIPCSSHCHAKPRCRWRIGQEEQLAPHRIKVVLVENKRVNGKVKQETVAVLGSVDAAALESFWQAYDPKLRAGDWQIYSLRTRLAFWTKCNARLKRLSNRVGDPRRIRIAIDRRIPWPREPERQSLELLEAEIDLEHAKRGFESGRKIFAANEALIDEAKKSLASLGPASIWEAKQVQKARERVARLK